MKKTFQLVEPSGAYETPSIRPEDLWNLQEAVKSLSGRLDRVERGMASNGDSCEEVRKLVWSLQGTLDHELMAVESRFQEKLTRETGAFNRHFLDLATMRQNYDRPLEIRETLDSFEHRLE